MAGHRRARGDWWRPPLEAWGGLVGCNSGGRRLRAFGSLAGNRALLRGLAAYVVFILAESAGGIRMLAFAYSRGGGGCPGAGAAGRSVFVVWAGLGVVAGLLVAGLGVAGLAPAEQGAPLVVAGVGEGLRLAASQPRLRLMLALLTADAVVVGALDLLVVILAISVLGRSQAWAGYLAFGFGVGAVLAATGSAVLVGRRLGGPILGAALMFSGALAALASGVGLAGTVALLALAGAGHSLLAVAPRPPLPRSGPAQPIRPGFRVP